jgi:SH3-like domain-containing protein
MLAGSRRIVVRGRSFRWKFVGRNDRWGGSPQRAHLVVQEEANKGKPLSVPLESKRWVSAEAHDGDTGWVTHRASLLPSDVALLIEAALDSGWTTPDGTRLKTGPPELSDYRVST